MVVCLSKVLVTLTIVFWVGPHNWGSYQVKTTTEAANRACMAAAKGLDAECLTSPAGDWEVDLFLP